MAGISNPRGLGIFATVAKRYLNGTGLALQDAVRRDRGPDKVKRWFAGPKLLEVKEHLRKVLG